MPTIIERLLPVPILSIDDKIRFWGYVLRKSTDDCWIWVMRTDKDGYGRIGIQGQSYQTHRIAYADYYSLTNLPLILHECNNPPCCNPFHLYPGTSSDNQRQKFAQKRENRKGSLNNQSKLWETDISNIHELLKSHTIAEVARIYNVGNSTIKDINTGKTWTHI